jgi:hypothetical protein
MVTLCAEVYVPAAGLNEGVATCAGGGMGAELLPPPPQPTIAAEAIASRAQAASARTTGRQAAAADEEQETESCFMDAVLVQEMVGRCARTVSDSVGTISYPGQRWQREFSPEQNRISRWDGSG